MKIDIATVESREDLACWLADGLAMIGDDAKLTAARREEIEALIESALRKASGIEIEIEMPPPAAQDGGS